MSDVEPQTASGKVLCHFTDPTAEPDVRFRPAAP